MLNQAATINLPQELSFEVVFSVDDFFISMDELHQVDHCNRFSILFGRLIFLPEMEGAPVASAEIPSAAIEKLVNCRTLAFARIDKNGVQYCREIPREPA